MGNIEIIMKIILIILLLCVIAISSFEYLNEDKAYNRKDDLISRVNEFPNDLLYENEKKQIIEMLNEVNYIGLLPDPEDLGGQISGHNRENLRLGQKLFNSDDFHMKRSLMIVLYHESRHWQDLKLDRFSLLKNAEPIGKKRDEYISKMALLEFFAYKDQHKLTIRLNKDNPKFILPVCAEFSGDGSKKFIEVTPELFGFGRSLFSNYQVIFSDKNLTTKEANNKFSRFMNHYKYNFPETAKFKDRSIIDCNHKYGF